MLDPDRPIREETNSVKKKAPPKRGQSFTDFSSNLIVTDHPAVPPIWTADLMRPSATAWTYGPNHDTGRNHDRRSTIVDTAVVAVTTASAIGAAMKTNTAPARYLGYH